MDMKAKGLPWWVRAWDALSLSLPLLLMGALALATWVVVQRQAGSEPPSARALRPGEPDNVLHGFTLRRYDAHGRLSAEWRGAAMLHYPAEGRTEMHHVRWMQLNPTTAQRSEGQARRVTIDDARRLHVLEGQVIYRRQPLPGHPGARLELRGEHLTWDAETGLWVSEMPLRLTRDGDTLSALRGRYDERQQQGELTGQIRATLTPRGPAVLRSQATQ
ncbi:LPS export ABC transporter periplasmic protein LptC [Tepidimonas alkaliphilus]|uniref:LPS export ABC transporter periplasmic protein LptC n=1 Tax=Tepidimonas alkaliphilus TaxID=2588942 RepID=A0A554WBD9_9BURK|nr:LPS export ABC transporter periplasmic protein LptC [Tepidimonas alkaliphilus]TSE20889.1 LPS export ABC transporter periplasmic protein LptC [Tepidimonas alkaliphilus]